MSTYYTYYLGYIKDDQIFPLGPFDYAGRIFPAISRSRSFASDLWQEFNIIKDSNITLSNEFKTALARDWDTSTEDAFFGDMRYLLTKELPKDCNCIEEGYFLIDDVKEYLTNGGDAYDLFYEKMSPLEYAERSHNEIVFGPPQPEKDCEGNEYTVHSCKDFMYFRYENRTGEAFEVKTIKEICDLLTETVYDSKDMKYVVVCSIG